MMGGKSLQAFLSVLVVYFVLSFTLPYMTSNIYVIYLISDIISAFVYAFVYLPADRAHFYRYPAFHYIFSTSLVIFLGFSVLFSLL